MINVTVIPFRDSPRTITSGAIEALVNTAAENFAKEIRPRVKDLKCKDHPNSNQTIKVIADKKGVIKIEKSFCCTKFSNEVQVNVKR